MFVQLSIGLRSTTFEVEMVAGGGLWVGSGTRDGGQSYQWLVRPDL